MVVGVTVLVSVSLGVRPQTSFCSAFQVRRTDERVCPAGSEAAKQQRPPVADAEEKKSQISADSGLSVMSGSQVCCLVGGKKGLFSGVCCLGWR